MFTKEELQILVNVINSLGGIRGEDLEAMADLKKKIISLIEKKDK